jgi:hypothetical protein
VRDGGGEVHARWEAEARVVHWGSRRGQRGRGGCKSVVRGRDGGEAASRVHVHGHKGEPAQSTTRART